MSQNPPPSPAVILATPTRGKGVRRINNMSIVLGVSAAALLAIGGITYTAISRVGSKQTEAEQAEAAKKPRGAQAAPYLRAPLDHGAIEPTARQAPKRTAPRDDGMAEAAYSAPVNSAKPSSATAASQPPSDLEEQARVRAWTAYYQQVETLNAMRFETEMRARSGGTDPLQGSGAGGTVPPQAPPAGGEQPGGGSLGQMPIGGTDPSGQAGKVAFQRQPGDVFGLNEDLPGTVHAPKPLAVMQGTAIPARMVDGATSDMPSQITAEVLQDVYDSMTGNILLIPQFTRIIGELDPAVSAGQDRLNVIWQRLVFPDTSSRQLGSMPGSDAAGYGGMKDKIDTHWMDKFGSALLISIVGAGAQLSQPQQSAFSGYSPSSVAAGAMTQQFSQLGNAYAQRGLSIPNTIWIRPGYMLTVKVNKDLRLPPYIDRRGGNAAMTVGPLVR